MASGQILGLSTLQLVSKTGFSDGGQSQGPALHVGQLSSTLGCRVTSSCWLSCPKRLSATSYALHSPIGRTRLGKPGSGLSLQNRPAGTLSPWVAVQLTLPST